LRERAEVRADAAFPSSGGFTGAFSCDREKARRL
jgi:hypothetical protein